MLSRTPCVRKGHPMTRRYLNVNEAASIANITTGTLRRWLRTGRLVATKPGGKDWRIDERDLLALLSPKGGEQ